MKIGVWLCRFRQRKGYGVHSPFAYSLIRTVINEPATYYAYADLKPLRRQRKEVASRRVDELLFRLSNHFQPGLLIQLGGGCSLSMTYMQAGCRKAASCTTRQVAQARDAFNQHSQAAAPTPTLIFWSECPEQWADEQAVFSMAHEQTVWVVNEPYRNRTVKAWWKALQQDPRVVLTFDLYEAGIVLFDKAYNKQNYIVNFM